MLELPVEAPTTAVSIDADQLQSAIQQAADRRSISVRDIHIVTGLVTGAVIHDALPDWPFDRPLPAPGPSHYAEAYELLNTRPFHTIDQPHDDLTIQMLARANAYLRHSSDDTAVKSTRLGGRAGSISTLLANKSKPTAGEIPRHITRRELVDLGKPNSFISKMLIEGLVQRGDFETLKHIGVQSTGRSHLSPRTEKPDVSELVKSMTTWTYKMVRTRFDRLHSEGLIEARKAADNAALEYLVPEDIGNGRSVFAHLPNPKEVKAFYDLTAQFPQSLP
ncbi:MAG: hypothetical protein KDA86_26900 [Planctomycetaceae bacterium]|nr:hypothetical protein [Planctomycetaceae bacterium]